MPRSLLRSINKNQALSYTILSRTLNRFTTKSFTQLASHTVNDCKPSKPQFLKEKDSKYFEHQRLEAEIYKWWEDSGYFQPPPFEQDENEPFVIPMPPPNVTGYLHMGHAIFVALQDIMARFHRMRGRPTLWLPGT
jgi:valyl-tRNA synthetase